MERDQAESLGEKFDYNNDDCVTLRQGEICDKVNGYVRPWLLWCGQWEQCSGWQGSGNFDLSTGCAQGDEVKNVREHMGLPVFTLQELMSSVGAWVSCSWEDVCLCWQVCLWDGLEHKTWQTPETSAAPWWWWDEPVPDSCNFVLIHENSLRPHTSEESYIWRMRVSYIWKMRPWKDLSLPWKRYIFLSDKPGPDCSFGWLVNQYVIHVCNDELAQHVSEDIIDETLEHQWSVREPIWHHAIPKVTRGGAKGCFAFVSFSDAHYHMLLL